MEEASWSKERSPPSIRKTSSCCAMALWLWPAHIARMSSSGKELSGYKFVDPHIMVRGVLDRG